MQDSGINNIIHNADNQNRSYLKFETFLPMWYKLGAAPQLECWNIGKMGLGILQYWVNGKIRLDDNV
jgi:hypothetical protein